MNFSDYQTIIQRQCEQLKVAMPDESELQFGFHNHQALAAEIKNSPHQALSYADFVQLAQYHPESGYYSSGRIPFGQTGDFTTAPELSNVFSQAVAETIAPTLDAVNGRVIEFGAGSGKMAAEMITQLGDRIQQYCIVEVSAALKQLQKETLQQQGIDCEQTVRWLTQLPEQPVTATVIGNELLDAIPAHRFKVDLQGEFFEQMITLQDDEFAVAWQPVISEVLQLWLQQHRDKVDWQADVIYEASPWRSGWVNSVSDLLSSGSIVLLDYGYAAEEFFNPDRTSGTVQCFYRHQQHEQFFWLTGLQDITSHVNFSELCMAFESNGFELSGFTNQADLLLNSGVLEQLPADRDLVAQARLSQSLQKLMMPGEMGEVVKAIAFSKNIAQNAQPKISSLLASRL